jgi:hypothetical protein
MKLLIFEKAPDFQKHPRPPEKLLSRNLGEFIRSFRDNELSRALIARLGLAARGRLRFLLRHVQAQDVLSHDTDDGREDGLSCIYRLHDVLSSLRIPAVPLSARESRFDDVRDRVERLSKEAGILRLVEAPNPVPGRVWRSVYRTGGKIER